MNVGALDRREKGETTLIQTTDPTARVSIPRSLRWNEITFPADWTLPTSGQEDQKSFCIHQVLEHPPTMGQQQLDDCPAFPPPSSY